MWPTCSRSWRCGTGRRPSSLPMRPGSCGPERLGSAVCDCLVALAPATADGVTLFAKNSDRPPPERQLIERHESRDERATTTTYLTIDGHQGPTVAFIGSRPEWMWGVEHGVNASGVAIGNATIYTTLDPRGTRPGLTGMDLVRLGLERASTAAGAVDVMTALLERHGQGGS